MDEIIRQADLKKPAFLCAISLIAFLLFSGWAEAKPAKTPEKIKTIIIGDRVVDIAYNLGVIPEAMVVRCAMWPLCKNRLKAMIQPLGCPNCVTLKRKTIVPETAGKLGIKQIIIEKHPNYCLYKPEVKPENVVPLLAGKGLTIEYVDFSEGLESAIRQTAKLVGRESGADSLIESYNKAMVKAKGALPEKKPAKKVLIIAGVYQPQTGKTFLRVEMPGGYSDRFLLDPLGCINVGDALKRPKTKVDKGHFIIRKLDGLIKAKPDVIIMTGDAFAVQKVLSVQTKNYPNLAAVPAIRNQAIYSLPFYADSSVIEYPAILRQWTVALAD
ncbi:MAG: ABC transporter substrate-binding protein [Deltaproteobacteria bacterium]|nr:ABC transporter substrate-binding protein [Deltaproteobacteria bacterium]MDL1961117.1 ABC transporter substrate-binding protein [Deltaproteobacteria bacterium]